MADARLNILDHPWHQVHAYRLHALPADFTFLMTRVRVWNVAQRPVPPNFRGGVTVEDVRAEDYDVALAHLDQWCDGRHNLRASPFRVMKQKTEGRIPLVVIMHGTPDNEDNRQTILRLIGDLPVVCNSYQAAEEWDAGEDRVDCHGLQQFRTIIHGYRVEEFWSNPLEGRGRHVVTICGGGNWSRIYHGLPLVERLKRDVPMVWYGARGDRSWLPNYEEYRQMLAEALVYFSPTRRAPMPGARTEAMLSGCCVVSVPGNDVEMFIDHGKTGFITENYLDAMTLLLALLRRPEKAWEIGQRGRRAARDTFAHPGFVVQWLRVLSELGVTL